jgi:tetratricopeptide (TPR) repeat protein
MLKLGLWLALLGFAAAAWPAHASSFGAKEKAAKRACLNGDATKGVQILTDLYILTNDALILYNQGRCYEQNNRYEDAIGRFREFLRKAGTDSDRADAESARQHIAECEAILGRKPAESPLPQPSPVASPVLESRIIPQEPVVATPPAVRLAQRSSPASDSGAGLRVAGIATASVGLAALAAGLVLNLKANSMVKDVQGRYVGDTYSSSKNYKTGSQIAYGGGAAFLAGGVIIYYLGVQAGHTVATPVALHDGAGAILMGAF